MYHVYFCTGVESKIDTIMPGFKPAMFETEEEAMDFVRKRSDDEQKVDPRDNCIEGTSRECWWEIYDGPMVENPGTDDETFRDPIYVSDTYYNRA